MTNSRLALLITLGGIEPLLQTLKGLEKRNILEEILTTNYLNSEQGEVARDIIAEFEELCSSFHALSFDEFYENYEEKYRIIKKQREIAKRDAVPFLEEYKLQPNSMKVGFISNLKKILASGEFYFWFIEDR